MIAFGISKRAVLWDFFWIGVIGAVVYGMSWPLAKELAFFPTIFLSYAYFFARGRMLRSLTIRESDVVLRFPFRRMAIPFQDIVLVHSGEFEAMYVSGLGPVWSWDLTWLKNGERATLALRQRCAVCARQHFKETIREKARTTGWTFAGHGVMRFSRYFPDKDVESFAFALSMLGAIPLFMIIEGWALSLPLAICAVAALILFYEWEAELLRFVRGRYRISGEEVACIRLGKTTRLDRNAAIEKSWSGENIRLSSRGIEMEVPSKMDSDETFEEAIKQAGLLPAVPVYELPLRISPPWDGYYIGLGILTLLYALLGFELGELLYGFVLQVYCALGLMLLIGVAAPVFFKTYVFGSDMIVVSCALGVQAIPIRGIISVKVDKGGLVVVSVPDFGNEGKPYKAVKLEPSLLPAPAEVFAESLRAKYGVGAGEHLRARAVT